MFITTFPNLSMKVFRDFPFSWRMPTRAMEVRWCGQLVAKYVSNLDISIAKLSQELGESLVNPLRASPFNYVGNTRHKTASSKV